MCPTCLKMFLPLLMAALPIAGCASGPGLSSTVSDLRGGSASAAGHEIQPVAHGSPARGESVALEGDAATDAASTRGWQRLLNPFQKSQRIPLPLSPESAAGDAPSEHTGF